MPPVAAQYMQTCWKMHPMQAAVSEERRAAAAAELATARARAADAAGDSGLAEEQAAVWEGRAVGLQARVRHSI